jgi:hypothetical protein
MLSVLRRVSFLVALLTALTSPPVPASSATFLRSHISNRPRASTRKLRMFTLTSTPLATISPRGTLEGS